MRWFDTHPYRVGHQSADAAEADHGAAMGLAVRAVHRLNTSGLTLG